MRKPAFRPSRLLCALLLCASASAMAAPADEVFNLLQHARSWDARQRPDMARSLLQKALLIQPDASEVLLLLGDVEARSGNAPAAQAALQKLEKLGPQLPATQQLRKIVQLNTQDKAPLAKVRLLARAGKADEALAQLRALLPDGPPPGELALEYYQILGASNNGMSSAQAALKQLAQSTGEWRYVLAQYVLLGNHQPTRQEAARGFAQLSRRPDVDRHQLTEAWKYVLNRLSDSTETIPFLEQYLAFAPDDSLYVERLATLRALPPGGRVKAVQQAAAGPAAALTATAATVSATKSAPAPGSVQVREDPVEQEIRAGLDALSRDAFAEAEQRLRAVAKKRPGHPEVLGGIGRALLKQGREEEAQSWFEQAARHDPLNRQKWRNLGDSALVVARMRKAEALDVQGKAAAAEQELRAVLALQPDNLDARVMLAAMRTKQGDPTQAETLLRDVLQRDPDQGDAARALVRLLLQQNRRDDVMAILANDKAGRFTYVQAGFLKEDADKLAEAGKRIEAAEVLHQALKLEPADPWARFSLARLYVRMKLVPMANRIMEEGMQLAPQDPSMAYASALYLNGQDQPQEALRLLATIPAQNRTEGMRDLEKRASIALAKRQAQALYAQGDAARADALLMQTERWADTGEDDARTMAEMWFSVDQHERGLAWMRHAAEKAGASPATKLYYAGLLNRAKRDEALSALIPELEDQSGWTELQSATLFDIRMDLSERLVSELMAQGETGRAKAVVKASVPAEAHTVADDRARARLLAETGDHATASLLLQNVVTQQPDDVEARMELARLLALQKQNEAARSEVRQGLSRAAADDIDNRLSAARLLVRIDQYSAAREVMAGLLRVAPNNPSVLVQAGRVERADRRYAQAMRYFEQARAAERAIAGESPSLSLAMAAPEATGVIREETLGMAGAGDTPSVNAPPADLLVKPTMAMPTPASTAVSGTAPITAPTPAPVTASDSAAAKLSPPPSAGATADLPKEGAIEAVEHVKLTQVELASASEPSSSAFLASLPATVAVTTAPSAAQAEIVALETRQQPRVETGVSLLEKRSSPGLSSMHGLEVPVVGYWPIGYDGHAFVQVDTVSLDADRLPANFNDAALFGKVQTSGTDLPTSLAQRAHGTSAAIGYENDDWRVDVGVVGMGFAVPNVVGGVRKTGELTAGNGQPFRYSAEVARRPITSTLLSYAGARDPLTGETWGGVVDTGGSLRVGTDLGPYSASVTTGYSWLTGRNVLTNTRFSLRAAIDRDWIRRPNLVLNAGLTLSHWRYSENQSGFTFGHGGYYSPQQYTALGLPVELYGRQDRWTYLARASVSFSHSSEQAADFYPTRPALQALAVGAALPAGYAAPVYEGGSGNGIGYALRLAAEYQMTPQLVLGGSFNLDRSSYYNPVNLQLYLRYFFKEEGHPQNLAPTGVRPYSQY